VEQKEEKKEAEAKLDKAEDALDKIQEKKDQDDLNEKIDKAFDDKIQKVSEEEKATIEVK